MGSTPFFVADDGVHSPELWKRDGRAAGTTLVKDITPIATAGSIPPYPLPGPYDLTAVGSTLFFVANDRAHGHELWKSDGTDAGTVLVKDINLGRWRSLYFYSLTALGDTPVLQGQRRRPWR